LSLVVAVEDIAPLVEEVLVVTEQITVQQQ
jgi:hypothetical protein